MAFAHVHRVASWVYSRRRLVSAVGNNEREPPYRFSSTAATTERFSGSFYSLVLTTVTSTIGKK